MINAEIKSIVNKIKDENSIQEAHLGLFYNDDNESDTVHIKGNKQGLMLFGIELIEAGLKFQSQNSKENSIHTFLNDWYLVKSDIDISHIEFSEKLKSEIEPTHEYEETFKDKVLKFFFVGLLLFVLASILVGAFSILSWIF